VSLFEEACALAGDGCFIDVTAFPVEDGEDGYEADVALGKYLAVGGDPSRITVSTDSGGCLPSFDEQGNPAGLDYGRASAMTEALAKAASALSLEKALPAFTSNPAELMRFHRKGRIEVGSDADLVLLDDRHRVRDVMARGRWMVRSGEAEQLGTFE
ncbi:MAG: amidohydrolase family protein, partial [Pseudomonadota bacterium]